MRDSAVKKQGNFGSDRFTEFTVKSVALLPSGTLHVIPGERLSEKIFFVNQSTCCISEAGDFSVVLN